MSQEQHTGLLLLGVGGGGCRLAAAVSAAYGGGLRALGVDTDALSNRQASAGGMTTLLLGGARLAGHGTGGDAIQGSPYNLPAVTVQVVNGILFIFLISGDFLARKRVRVIRGSAAKGGAN